MEMPSQENWSSLTENSWAEEESTDTSTIIEQDDQDDWNVVLSKRANPNAVGKAQVKLEKQVLQVKKEQARVEKRAIKKESAGEKALKRLAESQARDVS